MPSELIILIFIILGLMSGLLGGMLGIGGGVVTVPTLYFIFTYSELFPERMMQVAISTSLAVGVVTSAISTTMQIRKKAIHFSILKLLIPGLFIGCITGSVLAHFMSSGILTKIFGAMAVILGTYFSIPRLPRLHISAAPNRTLSLFGIGIGALSTLLGIGGGSLTFPVLLGYQVTVQQASANSSATTLLSTFIGTITYLIIAWHEPGLSYTFGYIELPAFIAISVGAILSTPLGVNLSHVLRTEIIKRIFGCCLAVIGLSMLVLK